MTIDPLGAATLSPFAGTLTTDMPTFAWTPLLDGQNTAPGSYTLSVTDKLTGKVLNVAKLTGTSYTLSSAQALTPGHQFTWSVTAVSVNRRSSVPSIKGSFTIAALAAPVLIWVVFGSSGPVFAWQPVADANHYYLKVRDGTTGQVVLSAPLVPGTSYALATSQAKALKPNRAYTWSVAAVSTNGKEIVWSTPQAFTAP